MSVVKTRPAVKNAFLNVGTSMLSTAGKSAAYLIGPAILSPKEFGTYAYLSWVAAVAALLGSSGFVQSAQRFTCQFVSRERAFAKLLLTLGVIITCAITAILLAIPGSVSVSLLIALATVLVAVTTSVYSIQQALLQARHDFSRPLKAEAGSQCARFFGLGVLKIASAVAAGSLMCVDALSTGIKIFLLRTKYSRTPPSAVVDQKAVTHREILLYSGSILLISALDVLLWQRGEMFFLGRYASLVAAGHFALASQMSQLLTLAPSAALTSLLPRMSEKAFQSEDSLNRAASKLLTLTVLLAIPVYCISILAAPLALAFWKPEYAAAGNILPQLMFGKVALLLSAPVSLALYAAGRQRSVLILTLVSGTAAVIADYTLIKPFGLTGAAWACTFNQTFTAAATFIAARNSLSLKINLNALSKFCIVILLLVQIPAALLSCRIPAAIASLVIFSLTMAKERSMTRIFAMAFDWLYARGLLKGIAMKRELVKTNA